MSRTRWRSEGSRSLTGGVTPSTPGRCPLYTCSDNRSIWAQPLISPETSRPRQVKLVLFFQHKLVQKSHPHQEFTSFRRVTSASGGWGVGVMIFLLQKTGPSRSPKHSHPPSAVTDADSAGDPPCDNPTSFMEEPGAKRCSETGLPGDRRRQRTSRRFPGKYSQERCPPVSEGAGLGGRAAP